MHGFPIFLYIKGIEMGELLVIISIFIALLALNCFDQKYKPWSICFYFLLLIVAGFSYGLPDEGAYQIIFYNSDKLELENAFDSMAAAQYGYSRDIGYTVINFIANGVGMSYEDFRWIFYALGFGVIFFCVYKKTIYIIPVLVLYMIYPFGMDMIQKRNFFMEALIFLAFYFYTSYSSYKRYVSWSVIVLLAATFHSSGLLMLPFVIFEKILNTKLRYIAYGLLFIALLMPVYGNYLQSISLAFQLFFGATESSFRHYAIYLDRIVPVGTYIKAYIFMLIMFLYIYYVDSKFSEVVHFNQSKQYILEVKNFVLYNFIFFPLYPLFSDMAGRFPRNCILMVLVSMALLMEKSNFFYKNLYFLISLLFVLMMGRLDLFSPELLDVIFHNNVIFDFINI